jgi:uncharacterized repeat protein (TIGR03843 family)
MPEIFDKSKVLTALQEGEVSVQGQFLSGSNYTFMGKVNYQNNEMVVVYKPIRGEQPLWDFPSGTLAKREVAAYLISEALGWGLVPPTIFRRKLPLGPGSLQQYIQHDPEYHYFNFEEVDRKRLKPIVAFDLMVNNADRKGSHILKDDTGHLWLIDHGVCFHEEDKLRTVVWDFAGQPIPEDISKDMRRLVDLLEQKTELYLQLAEVISPLEIASLSSRTRRLLDVCTFPHPGGSHRPYPWPPV